MVSAVLGKVVEICCGEGKRTVGWWWLVAGGLLEGWEEEEEEEEDVAENVVPTLLHSVAVSKTRPLVLG